VAYRGASEPFKLEYELDRNAEGGGDQEGADLAAGPFRSVVSECCAASREEQHAEGGEEEAIQYHVADLISRSASLPK